MRRRDKHKHAARGAARAHLPVRPFDRGLTVNWSPPNRAPCHMPNDIRVNSCNCNLKCEAGHDRDACDARDHKLAARRLAATSCTMQVSCRPRSTSTYDPGTRQIGETTPRRANVVA
eukprot:8055985-Alexandrium_andersonii.AAC.1